MKKIKISISVLLAIIMVFTSLSTLNVFAVSDTTDNTGKISDSLAEKLSQSADGDKISVCLWCNGVDIYEAQRLAQLEFGSTDLTNATIEEINQYQSIYNRIIREMEANSTKNAKEQLNIADEDIIIEAGNAIFVYLTADEIYNAAESTLIYSIDYYDADTPVENPETPANPDLKFEDKFKSEYADLETTYNELYYHYSENREIDWVLVSASSDVLAPMLAYAVIGDRVYTSNNMMYPFSIGYGVYDVADDKFIDLCTVIKSGTEAYEGLEEQISSLKIGKLIGDIDGDGRLSVLDATYLQKCQANLIPFPNDDEIQGFKLTEELAFRSDCDKDGQRTVADVTAIQRQVLLPAE